jgi:hypothetical protein
MDPIAELRSAFRLVIGGCRLLIWIAGTVWEGGRALAHGARFLARLRSFGVETLNCPRGHEVPLYGVWDCSTCPATFEGQVFRKCPTCQIGAAWTPCPECQLPVRNPALQ